LQPTPHPWPEAAEDVGVDAHSFKPIVLRFRSSHGTRGGYYGLVLSAKAIPYHPADFKRRGHAHQSRPGQQATGFAFGSTDRSGAGSIVVRAPWLTAGTTVAGLELHAVRPFTIRRSKHRFSYGATKPKAIHGLELVYGPASYRAAPTVPPRVNVYGKGPRTSTRFTTVYEVPRAPRVSPWSSVPADSIQIESGLTTVGTHIVHTLRIGYLQKHGLYITIRTPQSENTAVQIARSLRSG
jgi:hypothetical protein